MEKKLKKLFDYQRFEKNEKLEKLIRETESRYAKELSDDDLTLVNAAGGPEIGTRLGTQVGGLVGERTQVGGLVGQQTQGTVTGYNTGEADSEISSNEYVGGLVGTPKDGTINNCYNTGDVIGNYHKEQ